MLLEETLISILNRLDDVQELLQLSIDSLTTKKAVSKFLNKSEKTIDNYIKNKTFKQDVHYRVLGNQKVEFLPFGILEFKKASKVYIEVEEPQEKPKPIISDTSKRILKNLV